MIESVHENQGCQQYLLIDWRAIIELVHENQSEAHLSQMENQLLIGVNPPVIFARVHARRACVTQTHAPMYARTEVA